ncbi:uncharacterized protein LOC128730825 [Anopheles nili]|uniref:uncharacterized protein LOC128730825 n=1 Tax=Anopheles nili TaxID=185578 RepID=UPI00237BC862|nr:uncharacterized protein LOC128730825 [Anopheles nili]
MSLTFGKCIGIILLCVSIQFFLTTRAVLNINKKSALGNRTISYSLRMTKILCVDLPYQRTHLNICKMERLSNGTVGLNVSIDVPTSVNYFVIFVKLHYKYTTYRPFMIDWSMEYCQAYRAGKYNPTNAILLNIIAHTVPKYYLPCPHGNRTYSSVWFLNPKLIPSTIPSGDYRLDVSIRDSSNITLFSGQAYGSVRRQGIVG